MPKPINNTPEKLKPFHFHGVEINRDDTQATGTCPFCQQERKFSVVSETGQYRCVYCDQSGNIYTFLETLYQTSLEATEQGHYEELGDTRNLAADALKHAGLARSILTHEWLAPGYNKEGKLTNLYRAVEDSNGPNVKYRLMSTPGCKLTLFGTQHFNDKQPHVVVCEGIWDMVAFYQIADTIGSPNVLAVPGAGNFNPEWFYWLDGRNVSLLYDNDHPKRFPQDHEKAGEIMLTKGRTIRPGWDGMVRVSELANQSKHPPKTLSIIHWNKFADVSGKPQILPYEAAPGHHPDLPDGFDLRDLITSTDADQLLPKLESLMESVRVAAPASPRKTNGQPAPTIAPLARNSFKDLCADFHNALHFTQQLQDTLAVMLSVVISTEMSSEVDQIWLRVIGPPGSGKSTLAEAISVAREWVAPKSVLTGFHSGFTDYDPVTGEKDTETSLLHVVNNKTVVMKDADTLINSPSRDRILSELRDLFDGTSRAHYRTKKVDEFENLKITFVLCGTDSLRLLNRTFLGERFLDCEILGTEDTRPYLTRASNNAYAALVAGHAPPRESGDAESSEAGTRKLILKQATYGFIQYLKENLNKIPAPIMSPTTLKLLEDLAQFISFMRARKPDVENLNFRPRVELATRVTTQLTKLAFCLGIVLGKKEVDEEILRIVRKVVKDTSLGFEQEVTTALSKQRASIRQLNLGLNIPDTTLKRILYNMLEFGIVQRSNVSNNSGQRGRDIHLWELTPMMLQLHHAYTPPARAPRRPIAAQPKVSKARKSKHARAKS